jgi:hypothetical protein
MDDSYSKKASVVSYLMLVKLAIHSRILATTDVRCTPQAHNSQPNSWPCARGLLLLPALILILILKLVHLASVLAVRRNAKKRGNTGIARLGTMVGVSSGAEVKTTIVGVAE